MTTRLLVVVLVLPLVLPLLPRESALAQASDVRPALVKRAAPSTANWPLSAHIIPAGQAPLLGDYIAVGADGRMFSDNVLQWRLPNQPPLLGEQDLCGAFAARLLLSRVAVPTAAVDAWMELHNGDFLPGQVERFAAAVEDTPACWRVRIPPWLQPPFREAPEVRVRASWVRRIVRIRVADRYDPKTLWLVDGRRLPWFAIRFSGDSVTCLTDKGRSTHALSDIAELHLAPREDVWDTVLEELKALSSDSEELLVQGEIPGSVLVTAALKSARPFSPRPDTHDDHWAIALQPIWSVEPIWLRPLRVQRWRFFPARVVPLTRLQRMQGPAGADGCRPNCDWRGDILCDAQDQPTPWGWACQAPAVLSFPAPPVSAQFVSGLALDGMAKGGRVQGEIAWNDAAAPAAARTEILSDRGRRQDEIGPLRLDPEIGSFHLRLNAAPADVPEGSDQSEPWGAANWLSPHLELEGW